MGRSHVIPALALALSWAAGAELALAQEDVPTNLDPGGRSPSAPVPSAPAAGPAPAQPGPDGSAPQPGEDEGGFFYVPEDFELVEPQQGFVPAPAPLFHVVRQGDTLWDICFLYFNNPWEWPRVWSYNPKITNPHWIYPGDRVRLYPEDGGPGIGDVAGPGDIPRDPLEGPAPDDVDDPDLGAPPPDPRPVQSGVRLRRFSLVDEAARLNAFTVVGSVEEKTLLAEGDSIYLSYRSSNPPEVGERYTIYREAETLRHPRTQNPLGRYVAILGELEVTSVEKGKNARAFITDSVDVIERGAKVAPLPREFLQVDPRETDLALEGTVVAILGDEQLIGQNQVVFIDRGERDGLEPGHVLYVFRRGDAIRGNPIDGETVGQNDRSFPARSIGELRVVQVGKRLSAALVTLAVQEIGIGDRATTRPSGRSSDTTRGDR